LVASSVGAGIKEWFETIPASEFCSNHRKKPALRLKDPQMMNAPGFRPWNGSKPPAQGFPGTSVGTDSRRSIQVVAFRETAKLRCQRGLQQGGGCQLVIMKKPPESTGRLVG